LLIGNPTQAKACPDAFIGEKLGWEAKTDLNELVAKMIKSDLLLR
jgi:GDP-D-mannose dehydratase